MRLTSRIAEYERLKEDVASCEKDILDTERDISRSEKVYGAVSQTLEITDSKQVIVDRLKKSISEYELNRGIKLSSETLIVGTEKEIEDVSKEIEDIGVCPYCGNEIKGGDHEHC